MTPEYYTMDELRALGCPNELLMQYVVMTKQEVDSILMWAWTGNPGDQVVS